MQGLDTDELGIGVGSSSSSSGGSVGATSVVRGFVIGFFWQLIFIWLLHFFRVINSKASVDYPRKSGGRLLRNASYILAFSTDQMVIFRKSVMLDYLL